MEGRDPGEPSQISYMFSVSSVPWSSSSVPCYGINGDGVAGISMAPPVQRDKRSETTQYTQT